MINRLLCLMRNYFQYKGEYWHKEGSWCLAHYVPGTYGEAQGQLMLEFAGLCLAIANAINEGVK